MFKLQYLRGNKMSSDFVISSLLLIAAFTCRGVIATCDMTSEPVTTCSMDAGPLKNLFIPVVGSIGECRCDVELVTSGTVFQQTNIQFTNHIINKPNCPYKITFMDYNNTISCEKSETLSIPVNNERSTVFSITKDSSITDSTTTGGFCLNMTILQGMFNISCRPTSISGTTETDLTTSTEITVLNTNKDPSTTGEDIMTTTKDVATSIIGTTETDLTTSTESTVLTTKKDPSTTGEDHTQTSMMTTTKDSITSTENMALTTNKDPSTTGEDHTQTNMMTTTKDVLLNTTEETSPANANDEPMKEFPVTAVASGIAGGVVIIIIIIIVFICFFKKRQRNYDKPLSRTREDDYNYQNMQNESSENNQEAHQDQHSPAAEASSDVIVLENDMYVSYEDPCLIGKPPASNHEGIQNMPSEKTTNANDRNERTSSGLYTTCDVGNDFTPASKSRSGYETVDDQLFNANIGHPPKKFAPVTPDVNDNVYTLVNKKPGKKLEPDENTEVEKAPNTESSDLGEPGLEINEKGENVVYAVSTKPRTEQQEDAARRREEDLANMYAVVDKNRSPEPDKANNQKPPVPIKPVRL